MTSVLKVINIGRADVDFKTRDKDDLVSHAKAFIQERIAGTAVVDATLTVAMGNY